MNSMNEMQVSPEMMANATEDNILLSLRKRLDLLLRTGQLLLESAADTNRIRRNMVRAALFLGFTEKNLHLFIRYLTLSHK